MTISSGHINNDSDGSRVSYSTGSGATETIALDQEVFENCKFAHLGAKLKTKERQVLISSRGSSLSHEI